MSLIFIIILSEITFNLPFFIFSILYENKIKSIYVLVLKKRFYFFNISEINLDINLLGNEKGSLLAASSNGIAIIVDVLRASTTIPVAMKKGIKDFYIAKEVEDARIASQELDTLLMGERECLKLEKFDFGNSPTEISLIKHFKKSSASFTSSTGARRVIEAIGSNLILIGSIINAQAIAAHVIDFVLTNNDDLKVVIIPAFTEGSIIDSEITEDQVGSLLIAREFNNKGIKLDDEIQNEINYLEKLMNKNSIEEILSKTKHGQKLLKLEFEKDISFCAKINQINITPKSKNDVIKLSNNSHVIHIR
ncbi:MAG: 2-phosphosulfolactate phosphatase [Asgard group archaeon]|nr:2-phosphosulfolactate phosphatase [Asgard group archaeon]